MTELNRVRGGEITPAVNFVSEKENLAPEIIRDGVAAGRIVIPANPLHSGLKPIGIGRELRCKVNANIGNSSLSSCVQAELLKLETSLKYGADTVMDLSTGDNICEIRKAILDASPAPIGTVPVYEAISRVENPEDLSSEILLDVVREQAMQGVDYMTIHAGLRLEHLPSAKKRLLGIVSRGGAILATWMRKHHRENPFYEHFDELLEICAEFDVTLSLGDGLRPGCLADASDDAQFGELKTISGLVFRCRDAGVQAMVEGPGHIPLNEIQMNMEKERDWCDDAPFYILGPVVTDCAPGYDHISSAIGGALGAFNGAAMLCYVTPMEHLGLPDAEDVRNGLIAYRIAAHAADVALGRPHARDRDDAISRARAEFDWEKQFGLALDPDRAREYRQRALNSRHAGEGGEASDPFCTMCGPKFCSMRLSRDL